MPKDYIARLVYDRTHLSMAIVKKPLEVVGYVLCVSTIDKTTTKVPAEASLIAPLRRVSLPK